MCIEETKKETLQLAREIEDLKVELRDITTKISKEIEEKRKQIAHNIAFAGKVDGEWNFLEFKEGFRIGYKLPVTPGLHYFYSEDGRNEEGNEL